MIAARATTWTSRLMASMLAMAALPIVAGSGSEAFAADRHLLPAPSHGPAAVRELGDRLPEAARRNAMSPARLRELLIDDRTGWLDTSGRLYYVDPVADPAARRTRTAVAGRAAALYPLADTFALNSLPGADHTVFLDFDGAQVSHTAWNDGGLPDAWYSGWDVDGDPATFNDGERAAIQHIWARVSEDYAPFDVNVTTADPGVEAITRGSSSDPTFGTRVVLSSSTAAESAVCGSCGGIAYTGVFDWYTGSGHSYYQPAWVFPHEMMDDTKAMGEAASHESGHTLGLHHDGIIGGTAYYEGAAGWAPIMGIGYQQPVTHWSRGDYSGANNTENDLAVMMTNGLTTRPDEADGSADSGSPPLPTATALITDDADTDVFALPPCDGTLTVTAGNTSESPNLDIGLSVLTAAGTVITRADPAMNRVGRDEVTGLDATLVTDASPAFVAIEGVGSAAYSGYASIGRYRVDTTCVVDAPGIPTAAAVVVAADQTSAVLSWQPPQRSGTTPISGYEVQRSGAPVVTLPATAREFTFTGLPRGASITFTVTARNATGPGRSATVTVVTATVPGPARIGQARSGRAGDPVTATATWAPPASDGGRPIIGYRVLGLRYNAAGTVVTRVRSRLRPASHRSYRMPLPRTGVWRFKVRAISTVGAGRNSTRSNPVTAR